MSINGDHLFGGPGSGVSFFSFGPPADSRYEPPGSLNNVCAGCVWFYAVLPDCDFASIDAMGDSIKLRVIDGQNVFPPTRFAGVRQEPFLKQDGTPDEFFGLWAVTDYIGASDEFTFRNGNAPIDAARFGACKYIIGAEVIGQIERPTPLVSVRLTGSLPGAPAPEPYVFLATSDASDAPQVRLQLGSDILTTANWVVAGQGDPYDQSRSIAGGSLFRVAFDPDMIVACNGCYQDGLPFVSEGYYNAVLGCNLFSALTSRSVLSTPPADWGKGATLGVSFGNRGISFGKEDGSERAVNVTYSYYVDVATLETAEVSGSVEASIKWCVPRLLATHLINFFPITDSYQSLVSTGHANNFTGNANTELFCSPWSSRGAAQALGSTVTFAHLLPVTEITTDNFFGGFGFSPPTTLPEPFSSISWDNNAGQTRFGRNSAGQLIQITSPGWCHVQAAPRMLESTAPPHLPSSTGDVVDVEQCIFLQWDGVPRDRYARFYVAPPCFKQSILGAANEEPPKRTYSRGEFPSVPFFHERANSFSAVEDHERFQPERPCVQFTGPHKHFTLPMDDGADMPSLVVSIDVAESALAAKALNSPLARSSLLSPNYQTAFNEAGEFSPDSYISAKACAGAFSLGNTRADGTWLGQNAFFYAGVGAGQDYQIKASGLDFDPPNSPLVVSDGAAQFITAAECVEPYNACGEHEGIRDLSSNRRVSPQPLPQGCLDLLRVFTQSYFSYFVNTPDVNMFGTIIRYYNDPQPELESLVASGGAFGIVGTDWTFRQNYAGLRCTVSGDQSQKQSYLSADTQQKIDNWGLDARVGYKPLPVFAIELHMLCEAWCHKAHIERREYKRDSLPQLVFDRFGNPSYTSPPVYPGARLSTESEDVDLARSTFEVKHAFQLACNEQEASAFYARQPVTLYARMSHPFAFGGATYGQQLRGNDVSAYPALAFTFQSG